jgi:carboxymethylenebutenolidase
LQTALAHPELDAAVIYYGQLETDPKALAAIDARLLGVFANRDKGIPPSQVDAFEAGLKQAGVDARILRYDADHAFANPSGARYDQPAAADAWQQVEAFLAATLRAP